MAAAAAKGKRNRTIRLRRPKGNFRRLVTTATLKKIGRKWRFLPPKAWPHLVAAMVETMEHKTSQVRRQVGAGWVFSTLLYLCHSCFRGPLGLTSILAGCRVNTRGKAPNQPNNSGGGARLTLQRRCSSPLRLKHGNPRARDRSSDML